MTPTEFVDSLPGFLTLSVSEQVRQFCWYLAVIKGKRPFRGSDVAKCFHDSHCPPPSNTSVFLKSLAGRKPPFLLRKGPAYDLSKHGHDLLEPKLGKKDSTVAVDKLLSDLPATLPSDFERMYLEEALICFRYRAFRAAIVMVWNLAFDHLCSVILNKRLVEFNSTLPIRLPKAKIKAVSSREDFDEFKESEVLELAKSAKVITANQFKVLSEKLNRRNIAAHPSGHAIKQPTAEDFILDLVTNVVLKL